MVHELETSGQTVSSEDRHRELFNRVILAVNSSSLPPAPVTNDTKLKLYGLFKRITIGKLHDPTDGISTEARPSKPSFFNVVAYHKYEAWSRCDTLSIPEAVMEYVKIIAEYNNEVGRQTTGMILEFEQNISK